MSNLPSRIIGIDPGMNGALALIDTGDMSIVYCDIEGSLNDAIDQIVRWGCAGTVAVIEKVGAMPKQGLSSTFKFAMIYGHLRGALIARQIPIIAEPTPVVWKRHIFGATTAGKDKATQKTMARDKARTLYPESADWLKRVKDADRAEALLLAHYGLCELIGSVVAPQREVTAKEV